MFGRLSCGTKIPFNRCNVRRSSNLPALPHIFNTLKKVTVTVINPEHEVGHLTCLNLKLDPLIDELRIQSTKGAGGLAADLRFISSATKVIPFVGDNQLQFALKGTSIVLVMGKKYGGKENCSKEATLTINEEYLRRVAYCCCENCPEAIIAIAAPPINSTVPFFANILAENGLFSAHKVMGIPQIYSTRAHTLISRLLGLDPKSIADAIVLGGATPETAVPVLSQCFPTGILPMHDISKWISTLQTLDEELSKGDVFPTLSMGYSLAKFVHRLAEGVIGIEDVRGSAYIRTSILAGVKYLSMPVEFGEAGVKANLGLPKMATDELEFFESVLSTIREDITLGEQRTISQSTPLLADPLDAEPARLLYPPFQTFDTSEQKETVVDF